MTTQPLILVVEDSETQQQQARDVLGHLGDVKCVKNWMLAMEFLRDADFVVIDWFVEGPSPEECGILKAIQKQRMSFLIWTALPEVVPSELSQYVLAKGHDDSELVRQVGSALKVAANGTASYDG